MSRARNIALELYPEDETHVEKLKFIKEHYTYAYILHDKDLWEEDIQDEMTKIIIHHKGELKKPHWHVMLIFENPRSTDKIAKELDLKHVETCNFYAYARYLIHKDNPTKYQYKEEEVITNCKLRIHNALQKEIKSQEQDAKILMDRILNNEKAILTFKQLVEYAIQNDCLTEIKNHTYFYKSFCDDFGFRRI